MTALSVILDVVVRQVAGQPPEVAEDFIRRHRLEPLVFGCPVEGFPWRESFLDACRLSYARMAARAEQHRVAGRTVTGWLAGQGIASFVWRGVAAGAELYGDPALRYATDIDVMVRDADADRALAVLQAQGCRLRVRHLPVWYVRRHHLHWAMDIMPGAVPMDVHWAVDHPYRAESLPMDWEVLMSPQGRLQLAIYHAEKESRMRGIADGAAGWARVLREGPLLPWIDLALMVDRADAGVLSGTASAMQARGHGILWDRTMAVVDRLRGRVGDVVVTGVEAPTPPESAMWTDSRPARVFAGWLGCRPQALADLREYVRQGGPGRLRRWMRLVRLALDSVVCGIWIGLRSAMQRVRPGGAPC